MEKMAHYLEGLHLHLDALLCRRPLDFPHQPRVMQQGEEILRQLIPKEVQQREVQRIEKL